MDDVRPMLRDFLNSRRARISPQEAGLQVFARSRRVDGLRREEVALLAGISVEYYTRLEPRGRHHPDAEDDRPLTVGSRHAGTARASHRGIDLT